MKVGMRKTLKKINYKYDSSDDSQDSSYTGSKDGSEDTFDESIHSNLITSSSDSDEEEIVDVYSYSTEEQDEKEVLQNVLSRQYALHVEEKRPRSRSIKKIGDTVRKRLDFDSKSNLLAHEIVDEEVLLKRTREEAEEARKLFGLDAEHNDSVCPLKRQKTDK